MTYQVGVVVRIWDDSGNLLGSGEEYQETQNVQDDNAVAELAKYSLIEARSKMEVK